MNRNTRELFYTEHDQRFSFTRKGRKIHMGLSRRFCPIKLPSQFFGDIHGKDFEFFQF